MGHSLPGALGLLPVRIGGRAGQKVHSSRGDAVPAPLICSQAGRAFAPLSFPKRFFTALGNLRTTLGTQAGCPSAAPDCHTPVSRHQLVAPVT